jgi:hypothetical protein
MTIPVDPIVTSLQRQAHQLAGEAIGGVALVVSMSMREKPLLSKI